MANSAGFVVLNRLEDFNNDKLKIRVILSNNSSEDKSKEKPDNKSITGKK